MTCRFEGCDKAVFVNKVQLCQGHYQQHRAGKTLEPLRVSKRFTAPDGYKICTRCLIMKSENEFYTRSTGIKQSRCKACMSAAAAEASAKRLAQGVPCKVKDCDKPVLNRGLCTNHYGKQWREQKQAAEAQKAG